MRKELTVANIEQLYYEVKPKRREEALTSLLDFYTPKLSIVFCNTKRQVDTLTDSLRKQGYEAQGLHGDMKQAQRNRVMKGFRTGKADILVATDVAARGIDVEKWRPYSTMIFRRTTNTMFTALDEPGEPAVWDDLFPLYQEGICIN